MVGVLVQANYGTRAEMRIGGLPIDKVLLDYRLPVLHPASSPTRGLGEDATPDLETGSIIVAIATDAPLNAVQCQRMARRAAVGIARTGGKGGNGSGDIFLAFATGNPGAFNPNSVTVIRQFPNAGMDPLFTAVADATEEAIFNAMVAGGDQTGIQGNTVYGLPRKELRRFLAAHGVLRR